MIYGLHDAHLAELLDQAVFHIEHVRLGDLWLKQNNYPGAIREYAAVVALRPLDKAGALFNLAQAYFAARQLDKAELSVLGALEAAPGYRPAQQLLLQIEDAGPKRPQ